MPTNRTFEALQRRVLRNIEYTARRLSQADAVPGMDTGDYEQDLIADLISRASAFDPGRASFPTFADRVIKHRASELSKATLGRKAERKMTPLDAPLIDGAEEDFSLQDILPDKTSLSEDALGLAIDLRRILDGLRPEDWQACEVLLSDNITAGAHACAISRSTAHDRINALREVAAAFGLTDYAAKSDAWNGRPVNGEERHFCPPDSDPMARSKSSASRIGVADLKCWLGTAPAGCVLEYHRGFLLVDRVPKVTELTDADRRLLIQVAQLASDAAERGLVLLVQHRFGASDYGYRMIARSRSQAGEGGVQ